MGLRPPKSLWKLTTVTVDTGTSAGFHSRHSNGHTGNYNCNEWWIMIVGAHSAVCAMRHI